MRRYRLSLQTRLALAATLVFALTAVLGERLIVHRLRLSLHEAVAARLAGFVRRLANQADVNLQGLSRLVAEEAAFFATVPPEERAKLLARPRAAPQPAFDYGVLFIEGDGRVAADSLGREIWEDVDFSAAPFFQRAFAQKKSLISEPFSAPDGTPLVMFTHPVFDGEGRMAGFLAGGVDLANNRLLGQLTGLRTSRYGQVGIFTGDGLVVAHSDKDLILEDFENPVSAPPGTPWEEETKEVQIPGGAAILTVHKLASVDWLIAGTFPVQEVYTPIETGLSSARLWFTGGLALCCALVWWLSRRLASGLARLAREVETIGGAPATRVTVAGDDEAGRLALSINAMLDSLQNAHGEIRDLSARVAETEERERRAIAADLHDSVSQTLALANMRLGAVKKAVAADPAKAAAGIDEVKGYLEQAVGQLRTLIFDLSPTILYELGLGHALDWYVGEFNKKYRLAATFHDEYAGPALSEEKAVYLFRAIRELLANAAKHSSGDRIDVTLSGDDDAVTVEVADNGTPEPDAPASTGFGLRHLAERTRHFRGTFTVDSSRDGGFRVKLTVPTRSRS